jgi:uncharacterized protein (TIGR03000 family)
MRSLFWLWAFTLTTVGLVWAPPLVIGVDKQKQPQPATVRVLLPAKAKLTINDKPVKAKKAVRRFVTPALEQGKKYIYTFKVEFVRGQKSVTIAQTVKVRAGQTKVVSLRLPGTSPRYGSYTRAGSGRTYYRRFTPHFGGIDSIYLFRSMTADEDSVFD